MKNLLKISIRQQALFISTYVRQDTGACLTSTTALFVANLARLGFGVTEELLKQLNHTSPTFQAKVLNLFREVTGVKKNWTPLVKGWKTPTGETVRDHIETWFANIFPRKGVTLPCGHLIPKGTFPLERYNGCPYCGTPFEAAPLKLRAQGSSLKILELWGEKEVDQYFIDVLISKTALNATQLDSLKLLLNERELPVVKIGMKETLMVIIDLLIELEEPHRAQLLFTSPADVLRYLWYKHTGFLQLLEPKAIVKRKFANDGNMIQVLDTSAAGQLRAKEKLKLKYTRQQGKMVASWLAKMDLPVEKMAEIMHPKRGMWVRMIRALRLAEYAKRKGFEHLKALLDVFYKEQYTVWAGRVNHFRLRSDVNKTMDLLKQRPGLFARSLFSNMLWFGPEAPVQAFSEVIDQVPARLVFTLNMYAEIYFDVHTQRSVKPLGGTSKHIEAHPLLSLYDSGQRALMIGYIEDLSLLAMKKRFAGIKNEHKTIFIDPALYTMPVAIGDRSEQIQDLPSSLMGTRFPIEGDTVRLFLQWGEGLHAQHLDMDLSCSISYDDKTDFCSYSNLVTTGCKHSGDIQRIPHMVGTAEYINLDLVKLRKNKARYVTFTCNAYTNGALTPNLVVGWMNSQHKMKISRKSGVAFDPSCVQHQIRITRGITKGLVFGVLEVETNEIIWMEMPFGGQVVQNMNTDSVQALLRKLDSKLTVGRLLAVKAEAQGLALVNNPKHAEEMYTSLWAMNAAAVTQLLID